MLILLRSYSLQNIADANQEVCHDAAMDPITISQAVASGHHILALFKNVTGGLKDLGRIEMVNQVMEIQLAMMDLIGKQQELVDENRKLNAQVEELNRVRVVRFEFNSYWLPRENGEPGLDGPFSKNSFDRKAGLVRLLFKGPSKDHVRFESSDHAENIVVPVSFLEDNKVCSPEQIRAYFPKQ